MDTLRVDGATILQDSATIIAPGTGPYVLSVSTTPSRPFLYVSSNGNVGIGTANPDTAFNVLSTSLGSYRGITSDQVSNDSSGPQIHMRKARGSVGALSGVLLNDVIGNFGVAGYDGSSYSLQSGLVRFQAAEDWSSTSHGTYISFQNTGIGSLTAIERMRIDWAGNVGISSATPMYRLVVSSGAGETGNMLVVSTGASSVIRMTGAGEIYANRFYGDGAGLTGVSGSDNLGNHTATTTLNMAGQSIVGASSGTFSKALTTYSSMTVAGDGFSVGGATFAVTAGAVGLGTANPLRLFHISTGDIRFARFSGATGKFDLSLETANTLRLNNADTDAVIASFQEGGNVGIGTESPIYKLQVEGTGDQILDVRTDTSGNSQVQLNNYGANVFGFRALRSGDGMSIEDFSTGSQNEIARFMNDGKVGIGTGAPGANLHVSSASASAGQDMLKVSTGAANADVFVVKGNGNVGMGIVNPGVKLAMLDSAGPSIQLRRDGANEWYFTATPVGTNRLGLRAGGNSEANERFTLNMNGNVGISTGAPQARLDVLAAGSLATDFAQIWRNSGGAIVSSMSATGVLYPQQGDNLGNHTATTNIQLNGHWLSNDGGNEGVAVDNSGNVGIGTAVPGANLHVSSTSASTGQYMLEITTGAVNADVFVVKGNGYAGIGTASILSPLTIGLQAVGGENLRLTPAPGATEGGQISFMDAAGLGGWEIDNAGGAGVEALRVFRDKNSENTRVGFSIESTGNFGIGLYGAAARLQVKQDAANTYALLVSSNDGTGMMAIDSKGNVGIGTINPAAKFTIGNGGASAGPAGVNSNYQLMLYNGGTANSSYGFGIDSNTLWYNANAYHDFYSGGNAVMRVGYGGGYYVGIGTTTPTAKLHINTNSANGSIYEQLVIDGQTQNVTTSGSGQMLAFKSGASYYGAVGGYGNGTVGGVGLWGGTGSGAPGLYLTSAGNVGVGTTGPVAQSKLTVAGSLSLPGASSDAGFNLGGNRGFIDTANSPVKMRIGMVRGGGAATGGIDFYADQGVGMSLAAGGYVGIGTTTPSALLDIKGFVGGYTFARFNQSSGGAAYGFRLSSYGSNGRVAETSYIDFPVTNGTTNSESGDIAFGAMSGGAGPSEKMRIQSTGYVGIGTGAPVNQLHVYRDQTTVPDATPLVRFEVGGTATGNKGDVLDVSTTRGDGFTDGYIAQFRNAISTKLYIRGDGNVGISTGAPQATLDVNGSLNINGRFQGKAAVAGTSGPFDFSQGNIQYTSNSCGTFTFYNMKDGTTYMFVVKGLATGTCAFTSYSDSGTTLLSTHLPVDHTYTT
ncbi:MAG: hypothetical protein HY952_12365, partial [Elusimicrobia bacterium]|nr:hypothetical protein [Elusimicrobiota bacterium]